MSTDTLLRGPITDEVMRALHERNQQRLEAARAALGPHWIAARQSLFNWTPPAYSTDPRNPK